MSNIDRIARSFEEEIELSLATTQLDVFVMGPSLDDDGPSGILRRWLIEEIRSLGASIDPEHKDLISIASKKLGAGFTLAVYETYLVEISDLVVLIPDSAGSFCELGLFADSPVFGPKLLILANDDHPSTGSYLADGPLISAGHNRAQVEHVNYSDLESVWSIVSTRLEMVRAEKNMGRMKAGGKGP